MWGGQLSQYEQIDTDGPGYGGYLVPPEYAEQLVRWLEEPHEKPSRATIWVHRLCAWLEDRAPGDRGWWLLRWFIADGRLVDWLLELGWKLSPPGARYGVSVRKLP